MEHAVCNVLGVEQRGTLGDDPFDHTTGDGYVASTVSMKDDQPCEYADANDKGLQTTLYLVEATGALCPELVTDLRYQSSMSRLRTSQDSTVYGTTRLSNRDFYAHHAAAISMAAVTADAEAILKGAADLSLRNTHVSHTNPGRAT